MLSLDQVADAPVAALCDRRDHRISIEAQEGHRGRQYAAALVLALVQQLSRGAGDDGMDSLLAEMRRGHHRPKRLLDWSLRIGEEIGDAGERLVGFGVKDMQDRADQKRMAGLLPMVPAFQCPFGINQHVGDVLDISDFKLTAPDLEQRIVSAALRIGRIEQDHAAEPRTPAGGERPVLPLDVMDDAASRPGQQRRNNKTDALAASGRCETQHMLGPMVTEVGSVPAAEQYAIWVKKAGCADLAFLGPASRTVGRGALYLARTPDRHGDRDDEGSDPACASDEAAGDENVVCVSVEREPPPEEGHREIDRPSEEREPGATELRLEGKLPRRPLRRGPDEAERGRAHNEDLQPEYFGRVHGATPALPRSLAASTNRMGSKGRTRWVRNRMHRRRAFTGPVPVSAPGPSRLVRPAP
ncbi:hypothetical protein D9M73_97760 [compost metagenome]